MSCVIYCRVSSRNQAENGFGIDLQIEECTNLAEYMDLEVLKIYKDEAISGTKFNRPQLDLMLSEIKNQTIITYSLDRLGRSTMVTLGLVNKITQTGSKIITCKGKIDTSTSDGKLFLTMMAAISEHERNSIRERTYAGRLERKKLDGENGGRMLFGYKRVRDRDRSRIVINEDEAETVRMIFELDIKLYYTRDVCDELNKRGKKTKTGKDWYPRAVLLVKRNKDKYEGGNRSGTEHKWPRILEKGWEKGIEMNKNALTSVRS